MEVNCYVLLLNRHEIKSLLLNHHAFFVFFIVSDGMEVVLCMVRVGGIVFPIRKC